MENPPCPPLIHLCLQGWVYDIFMGEEKLFNTHKNVLEKIVSNAKHFLPTPRWNLKSGERMEYDIHTNEIKILSFFVVIANSFWKMKIISWLSQIDYFLDEKNPRRPFPLSSKILLLQHALLAKQNHGERGVNSIHEKIKAGNPTPE